MESRKFFVIAIGFLTFVLATAPFMGAFAQSDSQSKPITLKTSTFLPRDNQALYYEYWEKLVKERSKGQLIIKYVGGPETIPITEHHLAARDGLVDITVSPPSYYGALMPEGIATVASELTPMEERASGAWDLLQVRHHAMGLHFLGHAASSQYAYIWTNLRHQTPKDFKGRRYITRGYLNPFMMALGTSPRGVSMAETYNALQRGIADGVIFMELSTFDMKLYEVTKYSIDHPVYRGWLALTANLNTWNKLPRHIQDLLTQASIDADKWGYEHGRKLASENRKKMQAHGMEYIKFSPADAKWYVELAREIIWKEAIERAPIWGPRLKAVLTRQ